MYEGIVQDLIDELGRLPGVGPKSAQRIAFYIVQTESFDVSRLADILSTVREKVRFCQICGNVSEDDTCSICKDPRRDPSQICVVEEAKDVVAIERTREFRGLYHVLGGAISPIEGVGPGDAVGVLLPTVPGFGARLLRWVLGAYLTASGVATLAIAWSVHRATVRRVRTYLDDT